MNPQLGSMFEKVIYTKSSRKTGNSMKIPNIVFSCATLPKEHQITPIIECAKDKFQGLQFHYIESVDQISNIRLYDIDGNVIIPHDHFDDYEQLCTFLKYHGTKYYKFFDCNECAKFLLFLDKSFLVIMLILTFVFWKIFQPIKLKKFMFLFYWNLEMINGIKSKNYIKIKRQTQSQPISTKNMWELI